MIDLADNDDVLCVENNDGWMIVEAIRNSVDSIQMGYSESRAWWCCSLGSSSSSADKEAGAGAR